MMIRQLFVRVQLARWPPGCFGQPAGDGSVSGEPNAVLSTEGVSYSLMPYFRTAETAMRWLLKR